MTLKIKCKVITLASRLKSIAYECVPLVTILVIVTPFALSKGHSFIEAWGGICTAWAVIHYITKLCAYPYKQSNGVCGVNPNLESDPQKHNKGERMLHNSAEVLSVYALFMAPIWMPEVVPTIKAVWVAVGYFI